MLICAGDREFQFVGACLSELSSKPSNTSASLFSLNSHKFILRQLNNKVVTLLFYSSIGGFEMQMSVGCSVSFFP